MQPDPLKDVSRETLAKLRQYEALLAKWQKAVNLVSPATIPDAWNRHIIDSVQIAPLVPALAKTLYDLGSGAGFPGLALAMLKPELTVSLIESDQKKCTFMSTVSHETKTPVKVYPIRIEEAVKTLTPPDVVSARALKSLDELLTFIWPWVQEKPDLVCIFPKGAQVADEIAAAEQSWTFHVEQTQSITDSRASILVITNLAKKV